MKNHIFIRIFICSLGILLLLTDLCPADVVEGGKYTEEKSQLSFENMGGLAGASLPTERFYASDRYINAPLDRKLFVVGTDDYCYYANFKMVSGKKTLIVYRQSRTHIENCIYQKKLMIDPSGFAIFEKGGGECKPVYAESLEELRKNGESALRVVNNTVSINYCAKQTSSYGLGFRTNQKTVVEPKVVEMDIPAEKSTKSKPARVIASEKKVEKPIASPTTTPSPTPEEKPKDTTRAVETAITQAPQKPKIKEKVKTVKKEKKEKPLHPVVVATPSPSPKPEEPTKWQSFLNQAKAKFKNMTKEEFPAPPAAKPIEEVKIKPVATTAKKIKKTKTETKPAPRKVAAVAKIKPPRFTIQVGSFATTKEAETLVQNMKKTDSSLEMFITPAQVSGKTWYRVFVGRYASKDEVKADIDRIRSLSSTAAFIQSLKTD